MRVAGRAGFGQRAGLLRLLGLRGRLRRARRIGVGAGMVALAVPLAWPSGAGGQHLSVPSAGSVRSGLVRLADFVAGDRPPALVVPAQQAGTGSLKPHIVPAAVTRNVKHATGHAPGKGAGQLPAWKAHAPSGAPGGTYTSGPVFTGFSAATSTQVASGTTATSYLFKNADGSSTRQIYAGPVNYQTPSGSWAPINETLAQGTDSRWQETANSPAASFAAAGDDKALGTLAGTGGADSVSFSLTGAAAAAAAASGPSVTYAGILPGTGLTQTATATGLGESLVLSSASAASSWVFPLTLKGLTATLSGGSVDFADSAGNVVWVVGPPAVSSGTASAPAPASQAPPQPAWQLVTANGVPALELALDSSWLNAPGRVFPVTASWSLSAAAPGSASGSTYAESRNGAAETADNSGSALLPSGTATNSSGTFKDIDFLSFPSLGGLPKGEHVAAASLNLFDAYAAQCTTAENVSAYQVTGSRPGRGPLTYPGPSYGTQAAQWTGTAPPAACSNTSGNPGQGGWISLKFSQAGLAMLNSNASAATGLAVSSSQSDAQAFKQFDSANVANTSASTASAPASAPSAPSLMVTLTSGSPPQINSMYPPDNYDSATLTPELMATGQDFNSAALQYEFTVYSSAGTVLASTTANTTGDWTVPSGDLSWGQSYYWTVQDYDGQQYSAVSPKYFFSTPVPQPLVTSSLSQNGAGPGFDPQIGDWTTSATDANVTTVGPALEITRDYNSEDPRISGAFGAGWSSVLDMKVSPGQASSSGTTATQVVTYPDGEDVAFGLIGGSPVTYASPPGRYSTLTTVSGGGFTLTDKNDTVYTFTQSMGSNVYGITSITDALGHTETFAYNSSNQITTITSASGRILTVTWTSPSGAAYQHVASVVTDDATPGNSSTAQNWTYTYSGDGLATACPPSSTTACTAYSYTNGSDYPQAMLDSGPQSYWRLDETTGSTAASSVLLNEHTDDATYSNVSLASAGGGLAGSAAKVVNFNGTSSDINIPNNLADHGTYMSVSLWFWTTTANDVLFSYQANALTTSTTTGGFLPAVYIGSDGKLNAQLWTGTFSPMTSASAVDDGKWHMVTLTAAGSTQTLYLDGQQIATKSGTVGVDTWPWLYLGGGFIGGKWPDEPHYSTTSNTGYATYYRGYMSDAATWARPVTATEVAAMYAAGTHAAALLTKVTRPTGNVYAQVSYDPLTGRVTNVTDDNGGTWQVAPPAVQGSSQVYVASVLGAAPQDYWRLNDTGASEAVNLMNCSCAAAAYYSNVTEGVSGGPFADQPVAGFDGSSSYLSLPSLVRATGNETISLWFKTTTAGGVLLSSSAAALPATTTPTDYAPELYIGSDGYLEAEFWNGSVDPVKSAGVVDDGKWHNVVLAAGTSSQVLYVDGTAAHTLSGTVALQNSDQANDYVGAGYLGGGWPDEPNHSTQSNTGYASYFTGDIAEVAWYPAQLTAAQVTAQWDTSTYASSLTPVQTETVTDPGGNTPSWAYDLLNGGRVLSATDANGYTTTYGYDTAGFQDETTLAGTYVTETGYDVRGNMVSRTTCQDQAANQCSTSYWTYYPNDTSSSLSADPRNDVMLTYADGRSASATDTAYQTAYAYNAAGDLTSKTTPPVTGFPSGRTTTYAYTDGTTATGGYNGAVPPKGLPYQVTTPGGAVTTTLYYADGDVARVTDPDGQYTDYTYDGLGRKTSQTVYSDSYPSGLTTTYAYDANGRLTTQTDPTVTNRVTDAPHTAQTTTSYDADGDVTSQEVTDLTGGDASRTVTRTYNGYDQLASETDAANATTRYTYDPFGNVASKTDPDGNVTDYTYDGDGHLTATSLQNYTGSRDTTCQSSSGPLVEESRSYNQAGWLASVTDAMCNVTGYGYFDNGLVSAISVENPADKTGNTWFSTDWYSYDGAGNMTGHWTNNGATYTTYTLDAASRVTQQATDPSGLDRVTSVSYTPDDQQASVTQSGPDGTSQQASYTYDPAGKMLSQAVTDPGAGGPAAWFPLTQTSGTSVPDSAAGGQPATASGVTWSGSAAQFAGTSGQQVATAGPAVDTTGSFTVAAWVNLAANISTQAVVAQAAGTDSGFYLKYNASTGDWEFTRPATDTTSPASWAGASSGSAAATGTWTFLTGTYDANTGTVTLYVNGSSSGTTSGTDTTPFAAHGPLLVGAAKYNGTSTNFLDGQVANVQVYPRALSAAEVSSLYGLGQGGGDVATGKLVTTWTRDQRGLPTSMTSPDGAVTGYSYDEAGQLALTTGPMVTTETYGNTPVTADPLTWTGYDTFGEVSETKDADGNVTTYGYDGDGRQVSKTLPPYTPPGGSPVTSVEATAYDGNGNVTSASDGIGNTTTYTYDQLGDQVTATAPGNPPTTTAYDADRQPSSVTGPTGAQTQMTWDYLGRKLKSTQIERDTGSGTAAYTTNYTYDDSNGGWLSQVTSPDGVSAQYSYDATGAVTSVTDGAGNVTGYSYDGLGRQAAITYPDNTSQVTGYDGAGNVTSVQQLDASGNTLTATSATFDGEGDKVSATDANGNATTFTYDRTGLVSQEVQPVSAASGITTSFGYDAAGNQTRYTDGNGNSWQYTYNSWGLQESRVEPATSQYSSPGDSTFTTAYDGDGRPVSVTEPGGVTVTDSYNNLGELTGQSGAGADAATPSRSFGYDAAGNLTSAATTGAGATSESFTYNDRGGVLTASGSAGAASYGYNGDGQVTSVADAAGTTSYGYDSAGRLATLADPASGTTATYSYNNLNQVTGISYGPGGDTQSLGYDSLHRLTSQTLQTGSGTTVASVSYGYNPDGQITSQSTTGLAGPSSSSYTYDQAGRVTSWNNGTTTTNYGYDANGNLTQDGTKTYTYDARDQLTSDGTNSYTYTARGTPSSESSPSGSVAVTFDAYGDQASAGTQSYTYDALGRLTADQPTGSGASYAFSYAGKTSAIASDGASTYTWDPSGSMLVGTGAAGGGSGVLAFTDSHGDVLGQFAGSGTGMAGSQAYDPWGTVTAGGGSLSGRVGFQSGWADPASGKVLMGARWYAPSAGDFTSADTVQVSPVPDPAAGSPFAYAGDDPLDGVDPSGHACLWGVCTPAWMNRAGHAVAHGFDVGRHAVAATVDWGVSAGVDTVQNDLKLIRAAAARIRDIPHVVADAASSGIRKLGSAAARAITYVRPIMRAVTAPVRAGVRLLKTAVRKAVSAGRKAASAVRRAASATAGFVKRHAAQIGGIAVGVLTFMGCEAVTGGAGTVLCAMAAGAASSAVSDLITSAQTGHFSATRLAEDTVTGAVEGAVGGGLGKLAGTAADLLTPAAEAGGGASQVIVDTNAVFNRPGVMGALNPGESPVMTQTTSAELGNLVARGSVKMPRFAGDLPQISDVMDVNTRINIRGMIAGMKANSPGLFGDGSIGATALNTGFPVITADKNFAAVLAQLGVEVRVP